MTPSAAGGIALVVPAYFVCAGILLYTGIIAAVAGLYGRKTLISLAFAAMCLCSACASLGFASYYLAESVAGAVEAQRWLSVALILLLVSLFVFVALFSEARRMRPWYLVAAVAGAVLMAASFMLPHGMRYASVQSVEFLRMPWGEVLFSVRGPPGAVNLAMRLLALGVVVWSVRRLIEMSRRGNRRDAIVLAVYLVVLFATTLQGFLIDTGILGTFYWLPFALVGLALLMGANLIIGLNEQNRALLAAASVDELTGLANRRAVGERLRRLLLEAGGRQRHGAVLECDLDHFKVVNDALGQEVGDLLLREVAARMVAVARDRAHVARLGGNTFVLVTRQLFDSEEAARSEVDALAAEVNRSLCAPYNIGERSLTLTASFGIATFEAGATTGAEALARADTAVELAKRRGRNNLQAYLPGMQREAAERFRLVDGLRRAAERGELALHYQPVVDESGEVLGAEALLRWTSAELGVISPATFIPLAEETGLIHALGDWTLRTGCERLAAWGKGNRFPGYLAVNVSPWQLAHPGFVARLRELQAADGVGPGRITIEVTESAVLVDVAEAVAKLKEIRAMGVNVALDDFGTGYSSLALVKDLPLDLIKIDQSFVRGLRTGANRHLVRMIVAIGNELGIGVVAEGVETEADRTELAVVGCTRFQGYLFARPMPEPELLAWLAARPAPAPALRSRAARDG